MVTISQVIENMLRESERVQTMKNKLSKRNRLVRSLRHELYLLKMQNYRLVSALSKRPPQADTTLKSS